MKKSKAVWLVVLSLFLIATHGLSQSNQGDRQPAVAGQFYPAERNELDAQLKSLFSKAVPPKNIKNVIAIISPYCGYVYSGEVAASAFNQIDPTKDKIFLFLVEDDHVALKADASNLGAIRSFTQLKTLHTPPPPPGKKKKKKKNTHTEPPPPRIQCQGHQYTHKQTPSLIVYDWS